MTTDEVQWVVTGYTLALGVVVPVTAWLGDRFGLSRVYKLALLAFAAGSALCGLAWDLNSLGVVFAPAIGPTLGGYLVEYVDWRLIFFINVPIGILGAVAAALVLPGFPGRAGRRFDVLGFVTVAGGLFALLLALSEGQSWGWGSYRVLGLITFSVLSLALFVVIELEVADPLLDIRVFRYWAYTHSLLLIAVLSVVLFGVLFYIPLFLQQAQGLGAFDAGLVLLPQALVMGLLMPIAGRVYDRIGPRWPAASGMAILPVTHVNVASAYNNVVQRVAGALGLAVLTAIFTTQQAQQLAGRAALLPADTPTPLLDPAAPAWAGQYATQRMTELQVFVAAIDDLFLIAAALSALGALGALLLRSGPAPVGFAPSRPATTPSTSANGDPTRQANELVGVGIDTRPRET